MAKGKRMKKAVRYEKAKAKAHKGKHLGGPGKPDYVRGRKKGEVKNWSEPVHSGVIKKAIKDGVKEIDAKSGFTGPAIDLAKERGIKLISKGKEVK